MASFAEIRAEMRRKYIDTGEDEEKEVQQNNTDASSRFAQIRKRMQEKYHSTDSNVDDDYIGTFLSDAQSYLNSSQSNYEGMGYSDRETVYDGQKKTVDDLRTRSREIRQYLNNNKNQLKAESYDSLLAFLDDFDKVSIANDYAFYKKKENMSKWETEEAYNEYLRQQELNAMSSEELEMARSSRMKSQEDKDIIQELMLSNMPYNREYAEQDGRDMGIYNEVEKKRQYISEKYGVRFTENAYENDQILMDLMNSEEIAYTTVDGQNVTWDSLYKNALLEEDLNSRFEAYAMNEDWAEKSKAINTFADTESDSQIVKELTLSRIPNDWETAKANGVEKAAFDEVKKKRQYISEKYGIQFEEGPYASDSDLIDLMTKLERQEGEWDTFDFLPYLNYREKAVLSYIYETEGRTAALDWHNSRRDIYQARANADVSADWATVGEDHPIWGSVGSVALSLGSGVEYVTDLFKYIATGEDQYNTLALASSSIRSGVMESIDWEIGKWDVFDFLYSTGMSFIDSYAAGKMGTIFGKAAGLTGKALEKTAGGIGGTVLGLGAAAQATNDALNRGMSQRQAFWNGIVSGTFEGIFEKWSIGKFTALQEVASAQGKEIAKNIAKSMLVNASEEVATEVANVVYDVLFNGEFSHYETLIRQYIASGMSESEAKAKAAQEIGKQVLESGASGLLMGADFGVAGNGKAITHNMMTAGKSIAQDYRVGKTTIANSDMDVLRGVAGNSGVRYSIKKTSLIPYNEQLMQIENAKLNGSNSLYIGRVFSHAETGFSDAPFAMNQSDYRKSRRSTAKNESRSSHGVPYSFFEEMPQHLSLAPMFIDNGTKVSIVTQYKMDDTKGDASYVIAGVWRDQAMENDTVNQIKSVYPLDNFYDRIKAAAEAGKLVVTNRNKAEQMLATIGIQPSEVSRMLNLAKSRLSQQGENVKDVTKIEDVTQDIMNSYGQSPKFQFLRTSSMDSIRNSRGNVKAGENGGVKYAIAAMDNGSVFVQASRNVITGTTKAEQRKNVTDFFNSLLEGNKSVDIPTIEGDVLTITKAETADKARDDYKSKNGQKVPLTDAEFAVKLRVASHIDEIAEVSKPTKIDKVADSKNHAFAKDGFTYRRAYFQDIDGQYYEITISVGHNGTDATVYNVGKINKSALPSAKITAVVGSKPLGKALSMDSIRNSRGNVKARGKGGVY